MSARVLERIDLPDNAGGITLYDWMSEEFKDGRNLMRTGPDGEIVWKAVPVTGSHDSFVAVQWDGQALTANTWSCYRVSVDMDDGRVTFWHSPNRSPATGPVRRNAAIHRHCGRGPISPP